MSNIFEIGTPSSQQAERCNAAHRAYLASIDANGTRKGGESNATVEAMYRARGTYIDELAELNLITPAMISNIELHGRTDIAARLWGICNAESRDALLRDQHHFVRSNAVLAQADHRIFFTADRVFNPAHTYIGGEMKLQFWENSPVRRVRVVFDVTEQRFVFLQGRYREHFSNLTGTDMCCLNGFLHEQAATDFLEDPGITSITAFPAWMK